MIGIPARIETLSRQWNRVSKMILQHGKIEVMNSEQVEQFTRQLWQAGDPQYG